jgi:hypothetical protein
VVLAVVLDVDEELAVVCMLVDPPAPPTPPLPPREPPAPLGVVAASSRHAALKNAANESALKKRV